MSDRFQDPNWGNHGNPNRKNWYHFARGQNEATNLFSPRLKEHNIFSKKPIQIKLETIFWFVLGFLLLTAFVPSLREWVYSGIDFTEAWYNSVDSFLDALHVPQVPH
jgi:hypothetical protein